MEPIKIKILKRPWTVSDEEMDPKIPYKKRNSQKAEKENKSSQHKISSPSSQSKKGSKVLENSPVANRRSNSKTSGKKRGSSDDEIDDVFDEMLLHLHKSGFKMTNWDRSSSKNSTEKDKKSSSKKSESSRIMSTEKDKNSSSKKSESSSTNSTENKSRRGLFKEFEQESVDTSVKKERKSSKFEKKVPELEKLPEDLILDFRRTPKKLTKYECFETPKKEESVGTPRRSSRRRSSILNESLIYELERTPTRKKSQETPDKQKTPLRRSDRTPKNKTPSVKKIEVTEPKTPVSKITERLPTTPLEKARLSLHVSEIPACLPCREKEYENILTFLENKLWDCIGGCMYISGVPGTGKTATVSQVIRHLQERAKEGRVPEFKYIEINGMRLSNPRQAYVQLWQKLFDKKDKITPDRAQRLLDEWFSKSDRQKTKKTTVLLVDELDLICTKKQDVVYNLLDWPTRTHSRLVVLTIANTMDMPERLFKGRVTSRMGLTRLTFMPYTHKQLEEIVLARLKGLDAFVTDAVRLVTRKVAAVSGDARRALDICRRATELPPPDETVKISHIEQAIKEMTNSNIVKIIRNCGEMEKLFLRSLSDVSSRSSVEEVDLREVIDQLYAVCVLEGISRPSISSILSVSNRLKCCRLIFSNQSSAGILQRLTLNVTQDDIHYALRN